MIIENKEIKNISIVSLVLSNIAPVFGVLFFHWDIFSIMFLYWLESAVIGFFNILKMYKASGTKTTDFAINDTPVNKLSKVFIIIFFMFHYGIFMFVHGIFIFVIFGREKNLSTIFSLSSLDKYLLPILLLFVSHGISYYFNFIGKEEFRKVSISQQIEKPYARIIVMHFTILLSAWLMMALDKQNIAGLFLLIIIKIIVDLHVHMKEHE